MSFRTKSLPSRLLAFTVLLIVAVAPALALSDPAAGALFVFQGARPEATVLDPLTLDKAATAAVPSGAFRALALPRPYNSAGASKYYVVGPRAVTALDARFEALATIALPALATPGDSRSVMSPDGSRLALIAGSRIVLIDTASDKVVANLEIGFRPAAIVLQPDSRRALLPAAGSALARWLDFETDGLSEGALLLPTEAVAASQSADGARSVWFGSDGFYDMRTMDPPVVAGDLDQLLRATATPASGLTASPATSAASRLVLTDSGRFFLERDRRVIFGRLGAAAPTVEVKLGSAATASASRAPSWAASADGESLYVALPGQAVLARVDPASLRRTETVNLASEIDAVSLAVPRVQQQSGALELVSPNGRVVAGNTRFGVEVRAVSASGSAQSGVNVFVSRVGPAGVAADCAPDVTDSSGSAMVDCRLGDIAEATTVQLTVSDDRGRNAPIASVSAIPPLLFEGLSKIEGDLQTLPGDTEFTLTVQAAQERLPLADVSVSVSVDPDESPVTCPRSAVTGNTGLAIITCRTAEVTDNDTVTITVELGDSSVEFSITVDPFAAARDGLTKISGDRQKTVQGTVFPLPLVVSSWRDGAPRAKTTLNILFDQSVQAPLTCPINVLTNDEGLGSFRCGARNVIFQGGLQQVVGGVGVADFGKQLQEPFILTITQSAVSSASSLSRVSPAEVDVPVNEPVLDVVRVRATSAGLPVQGVEVYFFSTDDVIIESPVAVTDGLGIASTTVTMGCGNDDGRARVDFGLSPDDSDGFARLLAEPGPFARIIKIQGDGQSGAPGQMLSGQALLARTADICGTTITGQPVTWRILPEPAGRLRNSVTRSNNAGLVSTLVTLGNYGGPFQVEVGNSLASARFDLAVEIPNDRLRMRSGDEQMVGPGQTTTLPLVVDVLGTTGFGVAGVPVEFAITAGQAELVNASTVTNGVGVAFAQVLSSTTGPIQVTARAIGQEVVFALNGNVGPAITLEGIVNAGSFQPGLTPGGAGSIFGQFLSNVDGVVTADAVPFPTRLGGVQVRINGVPAPLIAVVKVNGSEQINFQTPFQTGVGAARVEVDNNGMVSTLEGVPVLAVQPGVFEITVEGQRIAAALHQDSTLITPSSPAIPGEAVQLYFTGGGALNPAVPTNQPGPIDPLPLTAETVIIGVDGVGQRVLAAFYAPTLVTAYQANFVLDPATASGMRTLSMRMGQVTSVNVTLPVGVAAAASQE